MHYSHSEEIDNISIQPVSSVEWMEFSPYEIGMPKYGTFMRPELFGSKFFIGHLVKKFDEPPLHFLQGQTYLRA